MWWIAVEGRKRCEVGQPVRSGLRIVAEARDGYTGGIPCVLLGLDMHVVGREPWGSQSLCPLRIGGGCYLVLNG